jgi:hypothetical protein
MPLTTVQPGMLGTPQPNNFKNRIINGAMVIDQRNGGVSVTPTVDPTYNVDRWYTRNTAASKISVQQNAGSVTPPVGFTNYLGVTSLSAYSVGSTDFFAVEQRIEGFNTADLAWGTANAQTITVSFWVRSSLTGTFGGCVRNNASNYNYPYSYTISSANIWEYKTVTIPGATAGTWLTTNGIGIICGFNLGVGSTYTGTGNAWNSGVNGPFNPTGSVSVVGTNGATLYITGVQLELGVTATGFDYRPYGTEFMLCQRYYQVLAVGTGNNRILGPFGSGVSSYATWFFKTSMRATPTVTNPIGLSDAVEATTPDFYCIARNAPNAAIIGVTATASIEL